MFKSLALISLLATAAGSASAQSADTTGSAATQAPAPVVRAYQANPEPPAPPMAPDANQAPYSQPNQGPWDSRGPMVRRGRYRQDDGQEAMQRPAPITETQPVAGVWLRSRSTSGVKTISATPQGTEIRVEHGVLNVSVHHPSQHISILVDLPGGQTSLLKDGLYTFNADTNTVRVLRGEAAAFPGAGGPPALTPVSADAKGPREKGIKVKEDHQLSFVASTVPGADRIKAVEAYPYELGTDLLPAGGDERQYANYSGDDGPYGYPYPYYAGGYGYPYGYYGYPYGYGIGIGYYGGFGGYRGGYRVGGFRR